jgi:polar amino acid transport system permease protein
MNLLKKTFLFQSQSSLWKSILNVVIILFILGSLSLFFFQGQVYQWHVIWDYKSLFLNGWLITIAISFVSFFLSSIIGMLSALAKSSKILVFRYLSTIYIEFIRGTPLLVQILFFFYVVAHGVGLENRYFVGVITLSLFNGAYLAEIFRSGIENTAASQLEAAKAIGLTKFQTYRFIIVPQAFKVTLPPLAGQFASLIKDSSLLSIIGINELTYSAQQVNSTTFSTLESFFPLALGYLLLTLPISIWSKHLEKRFLYET